MNIYNSRVRESCEDFGEVFWSTMYFNLSADNYYSHSHIRKSFLTTHTVAEPGIISSLGKILTIHIKKARHFVDKSTIWNKRDET